MDQSSLHRSVLDVLNTSDKGSRQSKSNPFGAKRLSSQVLQNKKVLIRFSHQDTMAGMSDSLIRNLDLNTNYPTSNKLLQKINRHKLRLMAHNHIKNAFRSIAESEQGDRASEKPRRDDAHEGHRQNPSPIPSF